MFSIREATEADYPGIQSLAQSIWPHTFGDILSPMQIDYMLNLMYSVPSIKDQSEVKGHKFILIDDDTKPVGYASYEINHKDTPKTKIHKIYLLPETQGKGAGRLMMEFISQKALIAENSTLILNVNRHNNAVKFYEKVGFKITGEEDIDIGNGYFMNDYVMEKPIK